MYLLHPHLDTPATCNDEECVAGSLPFLLFFARNDSSHWLAGCFLKSILWKTSIFFPLTNLMNCILKGAFAQRAKPLKNILKQITWRSSCCCQTLINLPFFYVCVELILWTFASSNNLHFLIIFLRVDFFLSLSLCGRTAALSQCAAWGCLMCSVNPYSANQQVMLEACRDCVLIMLNQTFLSIAKNILYKQWSDMFVYGFFF